MNADAVQARIRWLRQARAAQIPPEHESWWTYIAYTPGRGYGKTRLSAEDCAWYAMTHRREIVHVVCPTSDDLRKVYFEGPSGLLNCLPPSAIVKYNKTPYPELVTTTGTKILGFGAEKPDRLRGPQCHRAYCLVGETLVLMADGSEKPIRDVEVGDHVVTRAGSKMVTAACMTRKRATTLKVTCFGGRAIEGTPEHELYVVNAGWTPLGELKPGDRLCAIGASNLAAGATIAEAMATSFMKGRAAPGRAFGVICTGTCGPRRTARFLKDFTSTIATRTAGTTQSTIFSSCRTAITRATTVLAKKALRPFRTGERSWKRSGVGPSGRPPSASFAEPSFNLVLWFRQNFVPSNAAANGTSRATFPKERLVHAAVRLLLPKSALRDSALGRATVVRMARVAKGRASCAAQSAGPASRQTGKTRGFAVENAPWLTTTVVASVEPSPTCKPVYDLTVADAHEFFANGMLTHNCDELAAWQYAETWDQLLFGLRLGKHPRAIITTTPRPTPLVLSILKDKGTLKITGSTFDNAANLSAKTLEKLKEKYEGTRLGRQELRGEVLDDVPGALWTRDMVDAARAPVVIPDFTRIVVAIDPSGVRNESDTGSDEVGIVVAAKGVDGRGYVLFDGSCRMSPLGWGRRAVELYRRFGADRIIGERNFGGAMVEAVILSIDDNVPYKEVTASRGKVQRAEPVAALYEQGKISHVGDLDVLEDQMCCITSAGYLGEGSPDRVDACFVAGTLVETARGSVPIECVTTKDFVLTRQGFRRVTWAGRTGVRETVVTTFEDGRELTSTPEHPVWTGSDFTAIAATAVGESLWSLTARSDTLSTLFARLVEARLGRKNGETAPRLVPVSVLGRSAGRVEPVYNLHVDGPHEFFANGFLVHNCVWALTDLFLGEDFGGFLGHYRVESEKRQAEVAAKKAPVAAGWLPPKVA